MKPLKILSIFITVLLIFWSFLHIEPTHYNEIKTINDSVLKLKVLEGELNQYFFENQLLLNVMNYDSKTFDLQNVRVQKTILANTIESLNQTTRIEKIKRATDFYLSLSKTKENFLETLKSETAVLTNSLHYLSSNYSSIQQSHLPPQNINALEHLYNDLVLYNVNPKNTALKNTILTAIQNLTDHSSTINPNEKEFISAFLHHSSIVVENTALLHGITSNLNNLKIDQALNEIMLENNVFRNEEQNVANQYRLLLNISTCLLFALIIQSIWREQHSSNLLTESLRELERQKYALDEHAIVSITDKTGEILYVNQKFCNISGYTSEELIGQDHRILNSSFHPKEFFCEMWVTISSGKTWNAKICNRTKSGNLYWVQSTIMPFLDKNGQIQQFISIRTDITQQKELEDAAIRSKEWQKTILNILGDGVYTLDSEGRLTYMNVKAEALLGWYQEEVFGKVLHNLIHYQTAEGKPWTYEECPISLFMNRKETFQSETEIFFHKNGKPIPVSLISVPLLDNETVVGSVVCFHDISVQQQIEQELRNAKDSAEKASRLKSDFLSTMSHEIRTPMNGIIGMTDLLLDTKLDGEQLEFTTIVKSSANALLNIINDILDFSKIEADQLTIEQIAFSLPQIIKESTSIIVNRATEKGLTITSLVDSELPPTLLGDPTRLRQILLNFLSNAVKFTAKGNVTIRARFLGTNDTIARIRLEVTDEGIGISEEALTRLFQPFSQADNSTTRKYGGTGLGLSICKRLVKLMDGRIGVESVENEGSTFWMELPFEIVTSLATVVPKINVPKIASPNKRNFNLLLIEDNAINQNIAVRLLGKMGYNNVDVATNGKEGFDMVQKNHHYDLVLMDCQMPVMDGYEATRAIRVYESESNLPFLPIIAMTANAMKGDKERCIMAGMDDYVAKPINPDVLGNILRNWLSNAVTESPENPPQTSVAVTSNSPIDLNRMLDLFDGDEEVVDELLMVFYNSIDGLKTKLSTVVAEQSQNVKIMAHEIKGSASNVGAVTLTSLSETLEMAVQKQDWTQINELVMQIEFEFNHLKHFIENRT
jgi:PAS domain S-box-containing protein